MTATNGQEYYQTCTEKLDDDEDEGNGLIQTDTYKLDFQEDDSAGRDVDSDESITIDEHGQAGPASLKKTKSEVISTNNTENDVKSTDTAITAEISNEEKIDVFDNPDYEFNVIKRAKCTATNESALFTCVVCSYRANSKSALSTHLTKHSDERPFKCDLCKKRFKTKGVLQRHHNMHLGFKPWRTGERPYQCSHCSYAAQYTSQLKRHMRVHSGEKPYECDICHARFKQSSALTPHRLKHSATSKSAFQCHLCPTTFCTNWLLRFHIKKLHSSDQPIPCKRCGKELPDRYSHKMHIKTHEGEKFYRCENCPYVARTPSNLKLHAVRHLDLKLFSCEICESNFRHKRNLVHHMKMYHPDNYEPPEKSRKDNKCPHCKRSFAFNGHLIRHMKIHDADEETSESLSGDNKKLCYEESEEQRSHDAKLKAEYVEIVEYSEDNLQNIYDEYEAVEYEEQPKDVQYVQQSDENNEMKPLIIDIKPEEIQEMDIAQASFKKSAISSKAEDKQDSEIKVEIHDDQGFMLIKVMPDDGGVEEK